jgi:hypothetical protein
MTATLEDVRLAIVHACGAVSLRCTPYLTDQVNPPQGMIDLEGPTQVTFSTAGAVEYQFVIMVFDQRTSERSGQERFDQLRDPFDPRSLKRAIDDSTALAALDGVDYAMVDNPGRIQAQTVGAVDYLLVEFPVSVVIHQEA